MQTMFIGRLIDANRNVLAWSHLPAETRGDGGLWGLQNFTAQVQEKGFATAVIYHWPEVHAYYTHPLETPFPVEEGQVITIAAMKEPLLRIVSEPLPLPGVTVRTNVTVGILPGKG